MKSLVTQCAIQCQMSDPSIWYGDSLANEYSWQIYKLAFNKSSGLITKKQCLLCTALIHQNLIFVHEKSQQSLREDRPINLCYSKATEL